MLSRDLTRRSVRALVLTLGIMLFTNTAQAETVGIGTLAPKQSAWGKVYEVWAKAVHKKSNGRLTLQMYWNGQQGDEGAMIGKIRTGQLDAAGVTSMGLGRVYKPVLALQLPGLFQSWEALDRAREALRSELEAGIRAEGFELTGWGDVGKIRGMSKGFAVRTPADLKGKRPASFRDNLIGPTIYQVLGVTPVPVNVPEVLPALSSGSVNVLSAPSLAAEQLQWASRLDHISSGSSVMAIGGMVWSKKRLDGLPGDLRAILIETGGIASKALSKRIRAEDDAAYERMKKKMTVVTLTSAETKLWADVFTKVYERMGQGTFDPELLKRIAQYSDAKRP